MYNMVYINPHETSSRNQVPVVLIVGTDASMQGVQSSNPADNQKAVYGSTAFCIWWCFYLLVLLNFSIRDRQHLYHCTVFSKVVSAVHPEAAPTWTIAMLLMLHLRICNKHYILKINYHILLLKNYGCFRG